MSISSLRRHFLVPIFLSRRDSSYSKQDLFLPLRLFDLFEIKHSKTTLSLMKLNLQRLWGGGISKKSYRFNSSKKSSSSPYPKRSHDTKLTVVLPLPVSNVSLEPQTPSPSRYPAHHAPVSVKLKFSRNHLHNLESLLIRIPHSPHLKWKKLFVKSRKS